MLNAREVFNICCFTFIQFIVFCFWLLVIDPKKS